MGQDISDTTKSHHDKRLFMQHLLKDVQALETMLQQNKFETGVSRIGAEQEFFLLGQDMEPAAKAQEVLEHLDPDFFTHELALFNLEANLSPREFNGDVLSAVQRELDGLVANLKKAATGESCNVMATGILPTIAPRDLELDKITPKNRYFELNRVLCDMKGEDYKLYIKGIDELSFTHDNVLIEACNTSFQVHFQIAPEEFVHYYNIAQAITAPVLAVAANSPILLGKKLWHETRIALFQQSIDTRDNKLNSREMEPRVWFGSKWIDASVAEIFKEDISKFRILFAEQCEQDSMKALTNGEIPKLKALCLHNGTVYRWNRPCYGVKDNLPHLRIENRALPAGPTSQDAIANMAFYLGLLNGYGHTLDDVTKLMPFNVAKTNFDNAAAQSLNTTMEWFNGEQLSCCELIEKHLLPVAEKGLRLAGLDEADIQLYLGIIAGRVSTKTNSAIWMIRNFDFIQSKGFNARISSNLLTRVMLNRQESNLPLHQWKDISATELEVYTKSGKTVEQVMDTRVFTVNENDLIDFAAKIMHWNHLRTLIVECDNGDIVGVLSYRHILDIYGTYAEQGDVHLVPVKDLMSRDVITLSPTTSVKEAVELMQSTQISVVPIIHDGKLVGVLSDKQLFNEFSHWLSSLY
ncbi:glutamate-cysteine ligase family protein [Shewanella corallii]|uniref:Glutamate-cysteine ligase family protein n=1 Tax=Shewanella corallii TaxID=560080 RepID=A0ABT0N5U6_9GAMM|nr:CBS domain-containing protein [Shewanella corallii]MCL2913757.1 glutamate-cysteine ligase family protein [Shewanella corallii]